MKQSMWRLGLLVLAVCPLQAQSSAESGSALPTLVRGNEQFGVKLLREAHRAEPDRNIVVAPLPLTLFFGALQQYASLKDTGVQIASVFGWKPYDGQAAASKILLGAFDKPNPEQLSAIAKGKRAGQPIFAISAWIDNRVYFHKLPDGTSPIAPEFSKGAAKWFGVSFVGLAHKPTADDLAKEPKTTALPAIRADNEILYRSTMHVQMPWRGNTFMLTKPFTAEFHPEHGDAVEVQMQTSELSRYPHVRTELYEAAVLPCENGSMTVVLPNEGHTVSEVEARLAAEPEELANTLEGEAGSVTLTMFHLRVENDLRHSLETIGIREPFQDLGQLVRVAKLYLTEVKQDVDMNVDRTGIVGNSETIAGVGVAGVFGVRDPFHMKADRPFLFFIREQNTGALLYAGAVMRPEQQ